MNPGGNQAIYALVEKAAKMGNLRALFSLGLMKYRIGDLSFDTANGNLDEALLWYRRAAEQGDVDFGNHAGACLRQGHRRRPE
jgi:TPR repeat protein